MTTEQTMDFLGILSERFVQVLCFGAMVELFKTISIQNQAFKSRKLKKENRKMCLHESSAILLRTL